MPSPTARVWFGRVPSEKADEYFEYVRKTGVSDLRATAGNLGVLLLRREVGAEVEIGVVSFWRSREDIVAFAGPRIEKAVYYPEDRAFLAELAPELVHYDVTLAEGVRLG